MRKLRAVGPRGYSALLVFVLAISSCASGDEPPADPGVSSNIEAPRETARPKADSVEIGHGGGIDVEVGDDAVWVSTRDGVLRLDPASDEVADEIPLEGAFDLDLEGDSLWVTNTYEGTLSRIDLATRRVSEPVDLGPITPQCVDSTAAAVWVTASGDAAGVVIRIDPATNDIVARIHIEPGEGTGGIGCVAADEHSVWVTRGGKGDSLVRIDPRTNEVVAVVDIGNPDFWNEVVLVDGVAWVASGPHVTLDDGTRTSEVQLLRVDPETKTDSNPVVVGHGMFGLGAGAGFVWVYDGFHDEMAQVDPATGKIIRRIDIPDGGSSWGGDPGIDAGDGAVWMTGTYSLNRIDLP